MGVSITHFVSQTSVCSLVLKFFFPGQFTIFAPSDAAIEKLGADLKTKLQRQGLLFLDGSLYNDDILNHRYRCKFLGHLCIEAPPEKFLFCYFSGDLCAQDILR